MIFLDEFAKNDTDDVPAQRGDEKCLNCDDDWDDHIGWRCPLVNDHARKYTDLNFFKHYITRGMVLSLTKANRAQDIPPQLIELAYGAKPEDVLGSTSPTPKPSSVQPDERDLPAWKQFVHSVPGECPCGRPRKGCPYHG